MKQFEVKRAERPPMPANVLADLQRMKGGEDKSGEGEIKEE